MFNQVNHKNLIKIKVQDKIHYLCGAVYIERSNGVNNFYYAYTDLIGSLTALANENGTVAERYAYDPWGNRRNPSNWMLKDDRLTRKLTRGYTGHEHLDFWSIINMNGRVYDPLTASFFSPDPALIAGNWLSYNRYSYAMGNPFKYTDPSGEIVWFVPVIIGAVIGGVSGGMIGHANGAKGLDMVAYIAGGALIGGLSGGAASGVSALGAGAWWAGAAAGAVSGAGFSGLATNWNGDAMLKGAAIGALSGFIGGGLGSAIGGGWGAFAGGAAGSGVSTLLNQDFKKGVNWTQVGISALAGGLLSYGTYELTSYIGWRSNGCKIGNVSEVDLSYKQYKTMQADFQRSRFWGKEYGGFLMEDGSVQRFPSSWRHSHGIGPSSVDGSISLPSNVRAVYHTHWDAPGKTIWVDAYGNNLSSV